MFITDEKHHNTQFLANLSCDEKSICIPLPNKICNSAPSDLMKISNIYAGLDLSNCSSEEVVEEKWVDPSCQSQRIYPFFLNASLQ